MSTLIYLEDDEDDRFFFEKALNELGESFKVWYASSRFDLFYFLENKKPDFIFLDINLPDCNGIDCLKEIKSIQKWSGIPVILYTGLEAGEREEMQVELNVKTYIVKPRYVGELVESLKKVLL